MKSAFILIHSINDIYDFVKFAGRVDGDVHIKQGKYFVNGKSIMGLFSINLSDYIEVEYPENAIEFQDFIRKFA